MAITIRDVAAAAHVSPATVSRVLNGRLDVANHLQVRVRDASERLGYRPNGVARSLRTQSTTVLGAVVSDITNPFFTSIVRGIEDVAQTAGFSVVLANSDESLDKERRYLDIAVADHFAGVILSPASSRKTDVSALQDARVPIVTVDRRLHGRLVDNVTINNHGAAWEATAHLAAQGCQRIAFISGPPGTSTAEGRLAGFRAALRSQGLATDSHLVQRADYRVDGGYQSALRLLELPEGRPDAMLVSNNLMALGALRALDERGIQAPAQVAFASFDSTEWTRTLRPNLTVVEQPAYEIGQRAAQLLVDRLNGRSDAPQNVVLPTTLHIAASSIRSGGATLVPPPH